MRRAIITAFTFALIVLCMAFIGVFLTVPMDERKLSFAIFFFAVAAMLAAVGIRNLIYND